MAITFDTLQFVNELEAAGIERKQATAFVDIVKKSHEVNQAKIEEGLATKQDIFDLKDVINKVDLKIEVVKAELSILKWMLGLIGAGILTLIIKTLF